MNHREAKLILGTHRGDGRYADDDPLFAEALAESARSTELSDWLAREHALDEVVAHKLDGVTPSAGLREAILVGARASRLKKSWWRSAWWLAAACIALAAVSPALLELTRPGGRLTAESFGRLALQEKATHPHNHIYAAPLAGIQQELGDRTQPFTAGLAVDVDRLRGAGCATIGLDGRDVYELCFQNGGTWYHLYVTRRATPGPADRDHAPVFVEQEGLVAAAWSSGNQLYTLVTASTLEELKRLV